MDSAIAVAIRPVFSRKYTVAAPTSGRASAVSGSRTGSVDPPVAGAVAQRPVKATSPSPSADNDTAGSGRPSGLDASTRMSTPIVASTRPPGIGGSASFGPGTAASCAKAGSCAAVTGPLVSVITSSGASASESYRGLRRPR